jgi:hypothetical protein
VLARAIAAQQLNDAEIGDMLIVLSMSYPGR